MLFFTISSRWELKLDDFGVSSQLASSALPNRDEERAKLAPLSFVIASFLTIVRDQEFFDEELKNHCLESLAVHGRLVNAVPSR